MSETQYASLVGFIQFDPEKKTVNGQDILNFSVRAVGFQGQPLVQVTLWSEWAGEFDGFSKGDFVAIDGKYSLGSGKYHNVSAYKVFRNGELLVSAERESAPSAGGPSPAGGAF